MYTVGRVVADLIVYLVASRLRERLPTLLVVDDEEVIRMKIGKALKDYNVIESSQRRGGNAQASGA